MKQQLPKIHDRSLQQIDNPFYVPDEYEIFKIKEKEKQIKTERRARFQELKVHEKGVKQKGQFTIRAINQIGSEEVSQNEQSKLNIVEAADSAVKNRVRQREPMHTFIDKKREMLLFQMLIDHKRGMIDEFEKLTRLHRKGLEMSEQVIDEDVELFNKFLEANKNSSRDAIKEAEKETKLKQEKANEIKTLQEHRTDLVTKNQQKLDNLEDLIKYKNFLDRVTPKEHQKSRHLKHSQKTIEDQISAELRQILDDSDDDFDTYFKDPKQLVDIFQQLEERNLFLIANTKEREQMVEELRSKVDQKRKQLEDKHRNATITKKELENQIQSINDQVKTLKNIKSDNEAFESLRNLEALISRMYKTDVNPEPRKDMSGLEMLRESEKRLEQYIHEIKRYRLLAPDLVMDKEKNCIKLKKDKMKQEKQELDLIEQQRKQKEQQKEMIVHKRTGRPIMIRSWPPKEEKEEQVVSDISEEEKERLKFFT